MSQDGRLLSDADVSAIADAVAERVAARRLVSATTLAELLDVSPEWVRDHARELGGTPLGPVGKGRKPRWRFNPDTAIRAIKAMGERSERRGVRTVGEPKVQERRPRLKRAA